MSFINDPTRYLFFTGKGGVGKTSLACATAISLADQGQRVLLVSTDPASNLDEVLETQLSSLPRPVPQVKRLYALNIDPETAARDYRERMIGPYRGKLPAAAIASVEEQLSGACTVEIAAFDEFSKLLGDPSTTSAFDQVIFDTAPTGHTLRLLSLPAAWSSFLDSTTRDSSCIGPLAGLTTQRELYASTLKVLANTAETTVILVSRPEPSSLKEAERTQRELAALGISNQYLLINGVFEAADPEDATAQSLESRHKAALGDIPAQLATLPRLTMPLKPFGVIGITALRKLWTPLTDLAGPADFVAEDIPSLLQLSELTSLLAQEGHGVIMTMGKGGVGKTTIAATIALALAQRGYRVHLSTTDPAAHLDDSLAERVPNLEVSRIDPKKETAAYKNEVLAAAAPGLDKEGQALLQEELRSPCTEEIAVFRAFARTIDQGKDSFVVLDTAPTGHTLLLLDATEAYHRQVSQNMSNLPDAVRQLLPRLRDPRFTKILLITLPEATPVHEAAKLQQDLERAGIKPFGWIINQALLPLQLTDRTLLARRSLQLRYVNEVVQNHHARAAMVPWSATAMPVAG